MFCFVNTWISDNIDRRWLLDTMLLKVKGQVMFQQDHWLLRNVLDPISQRFLTSECVPGQLMWFDFSFVLVENYCLTCSM